MVTPIKPRIHNVFLNKSNHKTFILINTTGTTHQRIDFFLFIIISNIFLFVLEKNYPCSILLFYCRNIDLVFLLLEEMDIRCFICSFPTEGMVLILDDNVDPVAQK